MRAAGSVDRLLHVLRAAFAHVCEHVAFPMRHDGLEGLVGEDVLAADDERDPDPLSFHLAQARLQLCALG